MAKTANQIYSEVKERIGNPKFTDWLVTEKHLFFQKNQVDANMQPQQFINYLNRRYNMLVLSADGSTWNKIGGIVKDVAGAIVNSTTEQPQTQPTNTQTTTPPPSEGSDGKKPFFKRPAGIVVVLTGLIGIGLGINHLYKNKKK